MHFEMSWNDLVKRYMKAEDLNAILDNERILREKPMFCVILQSESNDGRWDELARFQIPRIHQRYLKVVFTEDEDA